MRNRLFLAGTLLSIPICILLICFANSRRYWSDESYKERIWLHRTNTPEKLLEFANEYNGFECDVLLRGDSIFDITHDEPVTFGISADRYFPLLQANSRRLWFDFKNLNASNVQTALSFFEIQCDKYQIDKRRLIIEGSDPEALRIFREAGFYTAFYVRLNENRNLDALIKEGAIDALSFGARDYEVICRQVTLSTDWLVWEHHNHKEMLSVLPRGRKILHDTRVKIILVKDKGRYHL